MYSSTKENYPELKRNGNIVLEPFIYSGYRIPGKSLKFYLQSMFCLHNNTVNIWTHAWAFLQVLLHAIYLTYQTKIDPAKDSFSWPFYCYILTQLCVFFASTTAHIFESKSVVTHQVLFAFDVCTIAILCVSDVLVPIAWNFLSKNSSSKIDIALMAIILIIGALDIWNNAQNRHGTCKTHVVGLIAILGFGIYNINLTLNYFTSSDPYEIEVGGWLCMAYIFKIISALTYTSHCPEKFYPGQFDLFFSSHQIMHVSAIFASFFKTNAFFLLFHYQYRNSSLFHSTGTAFFTSFSPLLILMPLTMLVLLIRINRDSHQSLRTTQLFHVSRILYYKCYSFIKMLQKL